jgi:hypothetical protein
MAGAGARLFPENSKLTSTQVNTFLMDQTIMRFATTTARDAAFGGVGEPTLAEGMTAYIDADNSIYTYDGSNWVKMVSASTPVGMELVKAQTVGTGATVIPVTGAFSASYDNYRIMYTGGTCTGQNDLLLTLGATVTGYAHTVIVTTWSTSPTLILAGDGNTSSWARAGTAEPDSPFLSMDIFNPFLARRTIASGGFVGSGSGRVGGSFAGYLADTNSYTSFTITVGGGLSVSGGTVFVYGYRK